MLKGMLVLVELVETPGGRDRYCEDDAAAIAIADIAARVCSMSALCRVVGCWLVALASVEASTWVLRWLPRGGNFESVRRLCGV